MDIVSPFQTGDTFQYTLLGVFSPIALLGIVGNLTILYVIGYKKRTRFGSDAAICIMAVCESMFAPMIMFQDKIVVLYLANLRFDSTGCKLLAPLTSIVIQITLWLKVYVSYSRMR